MRWDVTSHAMNDNPQENCDDMFTERRAWNSMWNKMDFLKFKNLLWFGSLLFIYIYYC